mmetsp:Transcript_64135/g.134846  ORF Transcript_64135/g.134846 Transcript_64135/m.134846 type:complete len:384 (-) Transcript_64135:41-1192(-)|eukprot:CAMPEP_0206535020 /NCGR_PEP_ID=MMETSP0325_2-20121206/5890_1 /ASSEMBLY_ACC=CAM_ASM_000347 /TAXON_ID=2866 /ORGANISM="Crypthecodinium cohnii, Strain Seligo" /LENGTH=383 /DNA_ID=CAMNT_0054031931 /DNA_START=78 /DNA_END=1229 /DNA_ORIENTATION=+
MSDAAQYAVYGVLLLTFRGLLHTVQLTLGRTFSEHQWPYFRLMALVCLLAVIPIGVIIKRQNIAGPEASHRKWVVLRGIFGACSFLFSILATQVGAPVGDVEALRCINMIAAALLGRVILGEELPRTTLIALVCGVGGALLISQPGCLFGRHPNHAGGGSAWIGDLLALCSGLCQACVFITSRMSPGTSVWVQALSSNLMSSLVAFALPMAGIVEDNTFAPLLTEPWQLLGMFSVLFVNTFVATMTLSAAAAWCSAAQSAIASTSSGMAFGFLVQTEFFGAPPNRLSLCGAVLMLAGVVAMTIRTEKKAQDPSPKSLPTVPEEDVLMDEDLEARGSLPLLNKEKGSDTFGPGASDASTCDSETREEVEDFSQDQEDEDGLLVV